MRRETYIVNAIEAAATLVASCQDDVQVHAILARVSAMVAAAWTTEYKIYRGDANVAQCFWDRVTQDMDRDKVSSLTVLHGPQVNPPGEFGNVIIHFRAVDTVRSFMLKISLNGRMTREDYDLVTEKVSAMSEDARQLEPTCPRCGHQLTHSAHHGYICEYCCGIED